ncbi:hypothetical protein E2C01_005835 [Portunus trituberculatus]|uniref:Uncharacterized protein n=1 Tax=Portunus trituberculatus TaxID=210409 RepID=A0A5B7CWI4_PORTR|nr:hypothetical protein [Portunus trituberculatus]
MPRSFERRRRLNSSICSCTVIERVSWEIWNLITTLGLLTSFRNQQQNKAVNRGVQKIQTILGSITNISILEDFNVHHQVWLSSPLTDHPGELAFNLAIPHDQEQLLQHPIHIPD